MPHSAHNTNDYLLESAIFNFKRLYGGKKPEAAVFAPGRVNLIGKCSCYSDTDASGDIHPLSSGEHTDYNSGFVLPYALDNYRTIIVGSRSNTYGISMPMSRVTQLQLLSCIFNGAYREPYLQYQYGTFGTSYYILRIQYIERKSCLG